MCIYICNYKNHTINIKKKNLIRGITPKVYTLYYEVSKIPPLGITPRVLEWGSRAILDL